MSVPRFHVDASLPFAGQWLELPDAAAHHAGRVLRLRDGDPVIVFDGCGGAARASIAFDRRGARARIEEALHDPRELPLRIVLAQGMASGERMDWIIEKTTELGVAEVWPVAAQRSVTRLKGERQERRTQHWQRVAAAACEQCGRNVVPRIEAPATLEEVLERSRAQELPAWVADPQANSTLFESLPAAVPEAMLIWVGPEGGWTDEELKALSRAGTRSVCWGSRILRTETAGVALVAALLGYWRVC
jgi:16S rRNA (uracil1498-N3)-methyltransferase